MAFSNIIREPRRELTETGFGILISGIIIGILYLPGSYTGLWFQDAVGAPPSILWLWTLIAMIIFFFGGWLGLIVTHAVGESFCDNMARRDIEMWGPRR